MSEYDSNNNKVKICILGSGGVGKTACVIQYTYNYFIDNYLPQIEDSYAKLVDVDKESWILDITDTVIQDETSVMFEIWIKRCEIFIIIYSITSRSSFDQVSIFKKKITRVLDSESIPIMLVGNKSDLEEQRVVSIQEGQDLANSLGMFRFMEISSKTKTNIDEIFNETIREFGRRREINLKKNIGNDRSQKKKCKVM